MAAPPLFAPVSDGVRVRLRVTPKASATRLQGVCENADGQPVLKVAVTAAPANGKANAAVVALLARTWRLPASALAITAGSKDRDKALWIAAANAAAAEGLAARLEAWAAAAALPAAAGGRGR